MAGRYSISQKNAIGRDPGVGQNRLDGLEPGLVELVAGVAPPDHDVAGPLGEKRDEGHHVPPSDPGQLRAVGSEVMGGDGPGGDHRRGPLAILILDHQQAVDLAGQFIVEGDGVGALVSGGVGAGREEEQGGGEGDGGEAVHGGVEREERAERRESSVERVES